MHGSYQTGPQDNSPACFEKHTGGSPADQKHRGRMLMDAKQQVTSRQGLAAHGWANKAGADLTPQDATGNPT